MFENEYGVILYMEEQFINFGFIKEEDYSYRLVDGMGILEPIFFIRMRKIGVSNTWEFKLSKTSHTGHMLLGSTIKRVELLLGGFETDIFLKNLDNFINSIFELDDLKTILRKKKLKKLKENVSIF